MLCLRRFNDYNKCISGVDDIDSEGECVYVVFVRGHVVYENSLYFPLNFAVNL